MSRYKKILDKIDDLENDIKKINELLKASGAEQSFHRDFTISLVADNGISETNIMFRDLATVSNKEIHAGLEEFLVTVRGDLEQQLNDVTEYLEKVERVLAEDERKLKKKKTNNFLGDF